MPRLTEQPIFKQGIPRRNISYIIRIAADKLGYGGNFGLRLHLSCSKGGNSGGKLFAVAGVSGAAADSENCGRIVVGILAQACKIYIKRRNKCVEVFAQALSVGGDKILTFNE